MLGTCARAELDARVAFSAPLTEGLRTNRERERETDRQTERERDPVINTYELVVLLFQCKTVRNRFRQCGS